VVCYDLLFIRLFLSFETSRVIPNDNVNYVDRVYSEVDQGEEEDNE